MIEGRDNSHNKYFLSFDFYSKQHHLEQIVKKLKTSGKGSNQNFN
jgi:hypothetical protein